MTNSIFYKGGYKYQLCKDYKVEIEIYPYSDIITEYIELSSNGVLKIKRGYAWDGASGPVFDTKNFMRGSIIHDALYQLMRQGLLPTIWRDKADCLLRKICREDGMSWVRSWYVYKAVYRYGKKAASKFSRRITFQAP